MTRPKNGQRTPMPSVKLDLPPYVIVRGPRADGTYRVVFAVKKSLRPSGWPAERTLPIENRKGDLSDPVEVAAIIRDAENFHAELLAMRLGAEPSDAPYSIPALAKIWQDPAGDYWPNLKPRTRRFYEKVMAAHIIPWSKSNRDADIRSLDRPAMLALFRLFNDRPHVRKHVRSTIQQLMTVAMDEGWITSNPVQGIRLKGPPKTKATIWTAEDVDAHVAMATQMGWIGWARCILALWETCARVTDAMIWMRGAHYDPANGLFNYDTNKTDEEVVDLPISDRLRKMLDEPPTLFLVTGPDGLPYEAVRDDNRMGKDFRRLNDRVVAAGGRRLVLRFLRHGAINHAFDCAATEKGVQSLTAHSSDRTLNIYARRSAKRALEVQKLRGIVK